ncbi:hypothetical protein QBC36DRAFT_339560 [Triangularia setosa]|uniref:Uncharacterized protein n=1 Tax=Triangularia setosa TaxID=2587417 RepID=A0AAN7A3B0_9PEZI|nr:hypothetical protein QBC36DRAFT_339560 [Podospora setosa]
MPDPITVAVGAAIGVTVRSIRHIADVVQTPEEVESATADIYACQRKLGELIELRKKHDALLSRRPAELAAIEITISTTWHDLQKAKPILERNMIEQQRVGRASISRITRRIRWKVSDRNIYQFHEKTILRNQIEVRDQISKLDQMVRLEPLEKLVERSREEEKRLMEEREARQASRDVKGLAFLDPVIHEVDEPVPSPAVTSRSDTGSGAPSPLSAASKLAVAPVSVVSVPVPSAAAGLRALSLLDDDEGCCSMPLAVHVANASTAPAVSTQRVIRTQKSFVRRASFS